jgi:mono/diheme cytochrome c family protein
MPVAGTVPVTGVEPAISPIMLAPTPANLAELERRFPNAEPTTAESIERGRDRYDIYCTLCHGAEGAGDGPVATVFPGVPSVVAARPQGYTDGYLYALIREGRGLMPEYGSKISIEDRWHIVNYLRVLQGTAQ